MNIKRIAVLAASTVLVSLQAQASLKEFAEKAKSEGATPGEIISFLRSHDNDHSLYKSIGITLKIWHDESYDKELWRHIAGQFFDLTVLCKQSENDPDDKRWLDMLGDHFKELYSLIAGKHGVHGNVNVSVNIDAEKGQLELKFYHDDTYDKQAWQSIIDIFIGYVQQINPDDAQAHTWVQRLGPLFRNVIDVSGDTSGIHGSLDAKLDDTTNYAGIGYTA